MARTRKNTVDPTSISIDWGSVDTILQSGERVSLSHLAAQHKVFPIDLRKIFEARYGDQIVFKRGRTGGVYRKDSPKSATAPRKTPASADASA